MTAMLGELPTWKLEDLYSSPSGTDLDADLKRAAADDVLLVQRLLHLVGELVRTVDSQVAQPRRVLGERGVLLLGQKVGILELVELEPEKHQLGADVGQRLRHVL